MSLPDCKRQKLADDVNSVGEMSNVSPKKDLETQSGDVTITASTSNQICIVNQNAQSFREVASMDGFVDRTMLIKELLEHRPTCVMIFAPSKFGKTINLNMIRIFCDIEDKRLKTKEDVAKDPTMQELQENPSKNMKVFLRQFEGKKYKKCLILEQEQFVIQHFGRHPVISFDFKCCFPGDESKATYACALQVREGYLENFYLENSKEFQSDDNEHARLKQACINWCSYYNDKLKTLNSKEVIDGLRDLIKSLRIHWGRDPVFLVDEVDKPCVAAMQEELSAEQVRKIQSVVTDVVCSIMKEGEKDSKLLAALVTGICKFKNSGSSSTDITVEVYFLGDARFSKYYGLTAKEVDSLVKKFCASEGEAEITKIINTINTYYNGYYQRFLFGEKEKPIEYARYCIFCVLTYIKERKYPFLRFWPSGGLIDSLRPMLSQSDVFRSAVQTLLYDDSGTIAIVYHREVNPEHLLGIFSKKIVPDPDETFSFFLQAGFLAQNPEKPEEKIEGGVKIYVRIPNFEIKGMYYEMFGGYFRNLPGTVKCKFTSCGEFFEPLPTLLERSMLNSTDFQESLEQLCANLKAIFNFINCQSEASVCSCMLTILKRFARYEKAELNYKVQYHDDNGKQNHVCVDVWGKHGNFALILQVKYNGDANGELSIGCKTKSSLAAAEDVVGLLPGKQDSEDTCCSKAGTGRNLEVLKSTQIENYLFIGLAVDGNGTTHMLVFLNSTDWKNVIAVNPENHVAELISTHLKSK